MVEEVSIEVAKARIYDNIQLQSKPPEVLNISPGTRVLLRLVHSKDDQRKTQERWTFRMTSSINGGKASKVEETIVDDKLSSQDGIGFLGDDYLFDGAGEFTLDFHVEAQVDRRDWNGGDEFAKVDAQSASGSVRVVVE